MNKIIILLAISCTVVFSGCAQIQEAGKVVWGSSIRHLEKARAEGASKAFQCSLDDCYDVVVELSVADVSEYEPRPKVFDIFINNRIKGHMVVMGIKGNVDTTEVGIFFEPITRRKTRIEISSLSSLAKEKVARAVFAELTAQYPEVAD